MPSFEAAKDALDKVIAKSRVHFYKPIQIAEILYKNRTGDLKNLSDLDGYRNISKKWRDEVSVRIVGSASTSSQKFQDNIFDANAAPPEVLVELGKKNLESKGAIETYIYFEIRKRLETLKKIAEAIRTATPNDFKYEKLLSDFEVNKGLKRSVDKVYEIIVFALFINLARELQLNVKVEIRQHDKELVKHFEDFIENVVGIGVGTSSAEFAGSVFRAGAANAADAGIDMWSNFGPAFQVKHLKLSEELLLQIADAAGTTANLVVICRSNEVKEVEKVLAESEWASMIQSVVTEEDLHRWYDIAFGAAYRNRLGQNILRDLVTQFEVEFPSGKELDPFIAERGYAEPDI